MMRNRIVAVSYLNTIPFIYGIEHAGIDLYADLLLSPPRGCASLLRDGGAEIALIPVAAVPSIPDIRIVTPFCIGASRSVRTVVLAADSPLDRLDTIYLDSHSLQPRTGYLIIGDKVFDHEEKFRYRYDLADAWREMTGLPFAFAAWVARSGVDDRTVERLAEALDYGVRHIPEAIACYGYGDRSYAYDYLTRNIDFVFDEQKRRATALYWQEGRKIDPPINPG